MTTTNAVPARERRLAGLAKILKYERQRRAEGFRQSRYFDPTEPVRAKPDSPKWSPT